MWASQSLPYQMQAFNEELLTLGEEDYPPDALELRDVFLAIGKHVLQELAECDATRRRGGAIADHGEFTELDDRAIALGHIVHELFSFIRYLRATSPLQSPPALQVVLGDLVERFFPHEKGWPLCIVRPQWKYNLKCVTLRWDLHELVARAVVDPGRRLPTTGTSEHEILDEILDILWDRYRKPQQGQPADLKRKGRPTQIGVLSFAGMDREDSLLYPMLAHELGHFIDMSYGPPRPRSMMPPLTEVENFVNSEVHEVLRAVYGREPTDDEVAVHIDIVLPPTQRCITELFADLLAVRMLGFGYFAALCEFLGRTHPWPESIVLLDRFPRGYPGRAFRTGVVLRHLHGLGAPNGIGQFLASRTRTVPHVDTATGVTAYIESWHQKLADVWPSYPDLESLANGLPVSINHIPQRAITKFLPLLERIAAEHIGEGLCARPDEDLFERAAMLREDLPPWRAGDTPAAFAEILSAAWFFQVALGGKQESQRATLEDRRRVYRKTSRLVEKALELSTYAPRALLIPRAEDLGESTPLPVGVLSHSAIIARLSDELTPPTGRIHVLPLSLESVKGASLDVRLGHYFATMRQPRVPVARLTDETDDPLMLERHHVPTGGSFTIHPGSLVLGATLEFLALPADVMAYVEGRSSIGRKGLLVATASTVAPGFHGVLILELANAGTVPLTLEPEMRIAQLVFQTVSPHVSTDFLYRGQFYCQTRP